MISWLGFYYPERYTTGFSDPLVVVWRIDVDFDEATFASQGLSLPRDAHYSSVRELNLDDDHTPKVMEHTTTASSIINLVPLP